MSFNQDHFSEQGTYLSALCEKYGSPLYVYDANIVLRQYNKIVNAFEGVQVKIKYAAKALTNVAILKLLRHAGSGLDVVSLQEAQLGVMAGYKPNEIMYTPNCVPFSEIKEAIEMGLALNIDNLPFLERIGQLYGNTVPVCIRINPHIEAGGNDKIKTGHAESKFGISVEQVDEIYRIVKSYNITVGGVHIHTGSDFSDVDVFMNGAKKVFEIAHNFKELRFLDFGSGFKVAYKQGDKTTDLDKLGKAMSVAFKKFCEEYGRQIELWFEPGKFLVSDAGCLLVKATVIKETPATTFVGIDSGLNHLIRPMMYGSYHHIINLSNPKGKERTYSVVGYICETDTFAWERALPETREGDVLAILNAGAYGYSMSSNYNSRYRPAEVLLYQGKDILIRKRETLEDITRNQIDIQI